MNISETAIITNIPLFIEQACQEINRLRSLVAELQAQLKNVVDTEKEFPKTPNKEYF